MRLFLISFSLFGLLFHNYHYETLSFNRYLSGINNSTFQEKTLPNSKVIEIEDLFNRNFLFRVIAVKENKSGNLSGTKWSYYEKQYYGSFKNNISSLNDLKLFLGEKIIRFEINPFVKNQPETLNNGFTMTSAIGSGNDKDSSEKVEILFYKMSNDPENVYLGITYSSKSYTSIYAIKFGL